MRALTFAKRNFIEILRDPISYIFGLGFPIVMLIVMTVINQAIPPEAGPQVFQLKYLSCGIAVFGHTFIMLSACILVSKDKSGAFLTRLYTSPMRALDFIIGYALPLLAVALLQTVVTFLGSFVIAGIVNEQLSVTGMMLAFPVLIPSAVLFVFLGIAFGFLLNDKSAPPVSSIIISMSGLLGGIWFEPSLVSSLYKVCKALPFLNAVECARAAATLSYGDITIPLLITAAYAVLAVAVACLSFSLHRKAK